MTPTEDDLRFEMALAAVTGDTAALNKAYRKAATLAHPDATQSGNGEQMVELNQDVEDLRRTAELASQTYHIAAILDDSGSMAGWRRREAVLAFNTFVAGQREVELGQALLAVRPLHPEFHPNLFQGFKSVGATEPLTEKKFKCGGNTPLLDGIASAIADIEKLQPQHVIVLIVTDGQENGSRTYRHPEQLRPRVEEKLALGWQFVYVSLDRYSLGTAERLGIPANCIASFDEFSEMLRVVGEGLTKVRLGQQLQITFEPSQPSQPSQP